MKIIRPTLITDSMLVSSSVPETEHTAWSAATYSLGDLRIYAHRVWECVLAGSSSIIPPDDNERWLDTGPTNQWAMFDEVVSTSTESASDIVIQLNPGRMNALALLELDATNIEVELEVDSEVVYQASADLVQRNNVGTWFGYFTEPITQQTSYVSDNIVDTALLDVPAYLAGTLTIRLINTEGPVKCGVCIVGLSLEIGDTEDDPEVEIINYSQRKFDEFGRVQQVNRESAKSMSARVQMYTDLLDHVFYWLTKLKDTPLVWIGVEQHGAFIVYGYGVWKMKRRGAILTTISINVEGLV